MKPNHPWVRHRTRLTVSSDSIRDGQPIPAAQAWGEGNRSPALAWTDVPEEARSFAILAYDPDAPGKPWTHWIVFNLPASCRALPEGLPARPLLPDGVVQGSNDYGAHGYGGPHPPADSEHRYVFRVYALDTRISLSSSARMAELLRAVSGHVLAEGELVGTFRRSG